MRGTWEDLNRRLTGAMLALDLDDALVVGERVEPPRRRLIGARPPAPPRRFVQVTAARSVLIGECVGSTSFGGDWPMDAEQEATLEKQGWERPWSEEYRTYQREAALAQAPRLALACVRALQVLGCEMEQLEVELRREEQE
ncbi:TY-Chap domain-containing protein [Nocardioides nanhaiensis]|uniref:TY-Chap N-terminal domain-containing protein n=1 Tax=Nocardioides nanhaiensis TaxID=1476871 RepID=A0ABP8X545_9ACTN